MKSQISKRVIFLKMGLTNRPLVSIVDDDFAVRDSLRMLFEAADFQTEVFASAEDFLAAGHLAESSCLVLDVQLPGISGIELQHRLRAEGNDTAVIFITAHPDEHTRQLAMRDGASRFFTKPFSGEELLTAVRASG